MDDENLIAGRITSEISSFGAKRVALQFPDELLPSAWDVQTALKGRVGDDVELFVLADTSYGDCCVDEVAAEHVSCDLVVHFGHACLSPTRTLPVMYIPEKSIEKVDYSLLEGLVSKVRDSEPQAAVVVVPELRYFSQVRDFTAAVVASPCVELYKIVKHHESSGFGKFGRYAIPETTAAHEEGRFAFIWVGSADSRTLRSVAVSLSEHVVHVFDPEAPDGNHSVAVGRVIAQRFAVVEKARHAHRYGIVAGTLSVSGQIQAIARCQKVIEKAGRRSYTICVGKPTLEKLRNFPEIEVFVVIACPENSLLSPKGFDRAVITPMELMVALTDDEHLDPVQYSADFNLAFSENLKLEYEEEEGREGTTSTDVSSRADWSVRDVRGQGSAATELQRRSYVGMEYQTPEDAPTKALKGKSGIASQYSSETDRLDW
uniref:2-(3-amino-3-carboxypropyl)histidine synthase subunit 2 n=1 Tax=Rhodosorus marinus TaxID=101924 RepID=A0A7S3EHT7_9RHOD|mmetsp:Transcript_33599/g.132516  ORF Transcript_33599/g.132516 Transcript_33599/m.132516 type:complete len:431 (+) Transcript_33599:373-1665(+)